MMVIFKQFLLTWKHDRDLRTALSMSPVCLESCLEMEAGHVTWPGPITVHQEMAGPITAHLEMECTLVSSWWVEWSWWLSSTEICNTSVMLIAAHSIIGLCKTLQQFCVLLHYKTCPSIFDVLYCFKFYLAYPLSLVGCFKCFWLNCISTHPSLKLTCIL